MAQKVGSKAKGKGKSKPKAQRSKTKTTDPMTKQTSPTRAASACPKSILEQTMRRCNSLDASSAENRGQIAQIVGEAEARHNLHRKAFKLARQLVRMDETKLAEFLFHFDTYREHLELDKAAGEDMLADRKPASKKRKAGNVVDGKFPPAQVQSAEPMPEQVGPMFGGEPENATFN